MFVGHALLAFALAALVAERRGWDRRQALVVGTVAGAFAAVPDIDVAYALVGLADWRVVGGTLGAPAAFWGASEAVHRSVTHSLVIGAVAAPAFGLLAIWTRTRPSGRTDLARLGSGVLLVGLVGFALVADGPLAAFVMALFAASGALVATIAARRTALSPQSLTLAALWGLWSHPWGDLVTGSPPDWLYPLESPLLASRIVLHADETLHLLGAFAIELAVIWLALGTVCRLTDRSLVALIDRRAAVAVAYGLVALTATPPTLDVSYHFVFSILGVGVLCGVSRGLPSLPRLRRSDHDPTVSAGVLIEASVTAVTAVTVALVAYALVYVVVVAPT